MTDQKLFAYIVCMIKEIVLNKEDLKVIFDVLNIYDPNDIMDVYPAMAEEEFLDDVSKVWSKVLAMIDSNDNDAHSDMLSKKKWE